MTTTTPTLSAEIVQTVAALADAAAAARRNSSDTAADAAGSALLELAEQTDPDTTPAALARLVAKHVARLHRADLAALRLVNQRAGRTDRAPRLDPESLTAEGRRAAAAGLTAGNVAAMSDEKVTAILAAHSGAPALWHRPTDRAALRMAHHAAAVPEHVAALLAPAHVTPETPGARLARPAGARWEQVSTDRGTYDDNSSDTGTVRYIRSRQSGAGTSAYTLAAVHSAEATALREATADALTLAACLPWQPTSAANARAWLALAAQVGGESLAEWLTEHTHTMTATRTGERLAASRIGWQAISEATGAPRETTKRTLREWAHATEATAHRLMRPRRIRPDLADPLPAWTSAPRPTLALATPDGTAAALDTVRRILATTSQGISDRGQHRGHVHPAAVRQQVYAALADAFRPAPLLPTVNRPAHLAAVTDSSLTPSARTAARASGPVQRGEILTPLAWHPHGRRRLADYDAAPRAPHTAEPYRSAAAVRMASDLEAIHHAAAAWRWLAGQIGHA